MIDQPDPPLDQQQVTDLLSQQQPEVSDLVRYLLVMSMVDSGKAKIVRALTMSGRHYLRIETDADDLFWIRRPSVSIENELRMRKEVKAVLEER